MTLIDILLHEYLRDLFTAAQRERPGLNARLLPGTPRGVEDLFGGRGAVVRIRATDGASLLVTPRRLYREVGVHVSPLASWAELVGYDWISTDLAEKVALKEQHFDRLILHLRGGHKLVVDHLGQAVYPLMDFLGRALAVRSQKVIRRRLDDHVAAVVSRALRAAVEGPFFTDADLAVRFGTDRASLTVLAGMWRRMNLAAPDLLGAVSSVVDALLECRERDPEVWDAWVGATPEQLEAAREVFRRVVGEEVG